MADLASSASSAAASAATGGASDIIAAVSNVFSSVMGYFGLKLQTQAAQTIEGRADAFSYAKSKNNTAVIMVVVLVIAVVALLIFSDKKPT